jgi:hypothetical protein
MALEKYFKNSYFTIENPLRLLDRWLHLYCHHRTVYIEDKKLRVEWTQRANLALQARTELLIVEMQLYFSCVVKKRVLFHKESELKTVGVCEAMKVAFRPIQAAACNPEEFAKNYPIGRVLNSPAVTKMIPSRLSIDFSQGHWEGEFSYDS